MNEKRKTNIDVALFEKKLPIMLISEKLMYSKNNIQRYYISFPKSQSSILAVYNNHPILLLSDINHILAHIKAKTVQ